MNRVTLDEQNARQQFHFNSSLFDVLKVPTPVL